MNANVKTHWLDIITQILYPDPDHMLTPGVNEALDCVQWTFLRQQEFKSQENGYIKFLE